MPAKILLKFTPFMHYWGIYLVSLYMLDLFVAVPCNTHETPCFIILGTHCQVGINIDTWHQIVHGVIKRRDSNNESKTNFGIQCPCLPKELYGIFDSVE